MAAEQRTFGCGFLLVVLARFLGASEHCGCRGKELLFSCLILRILQAQLCLRQKGKSCNGGRNAPDVLALPAIVLIHREARCSADTTNHYEQAMNTSITSLTADDLQKDVRSNFWALAGAVPVEVAQMLGPEGPQRPKSIYNR